MESFIAVVCPVGRISYSVYLFCHRPIKGIKGLMREVVMALISKIESQEFRRCYGKEKGLLPEHPRAASADDMEEFLPSYMNCWA